MTVTLYRLVSTVVTGVHTHSVPYNTWLKAGVPLSVWRSFAWRSNRDEMLRHLHSFHVVPASSPSCCRQLKNAPWASHFGLSLLPSRSLSVRLCVRVCVCPLLLGAFAKLRKATISFVMPRLLLDEFVWNFGIRYLKMWHPRCVRSITQSCSVYISIYK